MDSDYLTNLTAEVVDQITTHLPDEALARLAYTSSTARSQTSVVRQRDSVYWSQKLEDLINEYGLTDLDRTGLDPGALYRQLYDLRHCIGNGQKLNKLLTHAAEKGYMETVKLIGTGNRLDSVYLNPDVVGAIENKHYDVADYIVDTFKVSYDSVYRTAVLYGNKHSVLWILENKKIDPKTVRESVQVSREMCHYDLADEIERA